MVYLEDEGLTDPALLLASLIFLPRDRLTQGNCPEAELQQICNSWQNPNLFNHVDSDVVQALVEIASICQFQTNISYQAVRLIQSHLLQHMQHLPKFLQLLPENLKLNLLSALCVASEPLDSNRSIIWKAIHTHMALISSAIESQESIEIVRFYTQYADSDEMKSTVPSTLIHNGIWRYLCSTWNQSQLHTETVLTGLQSASLADYFSRANIRTAETMNSTNGIAVVIALSLFASHEIELWRERSIQFFTHLISEAFTDPNRLIHVLDMLPDWESFRTSLFAKKLMHLRISLRTIEGGPSSKTAKRLKRILELKLKSSIKSD